jgi:hypothetical protein
MSFDLRISAIGALQKCGLLTDAEQEQAVSHPRLSELPDRPTRQATLAWLLRVEVIDGESLLAAAKWQGRSLDPEARKARLALVEPVIVKISQDSIDALRDEGLVSHEVHQVLALSVNVDYMLLTPSAALLLAVQCGLLPLERFQALRTSPANQRSAAANTILADTATVLAQQQGAAKREFVARWLPGPRWMWTVGALMVIGAVCLSSTPSKTQRSAASEPLASTLPACDSVEAHMTIFQMMMMDTDRPLSSLDDDSNPQVTQEREIGYNRVQQQRGCIAQVAILDEKRVFAYIIARAASPDSHQAMLRGAQPEIVQARFGTLDANGDFAQQGDPVGRASLEQAFRAGVAAIADDPMNQLAQVMKRLKRHPLNGAAEERANDIEPMGECRPLKENESYVCPLLVEWENPMIAMIVSKSRQILHGEFTFERNERDAEQPWRVSAGFSAELERAAMAALEKKMVQDRAQASN